LTASELDSQMDASGIQSSDLGTNSYRMSRHILIVEQDDDVRCALQRWLASDGFRITTVDEGKRVIKILETEDVDLIVMDPFLPDTDGLRLATEVRKHYNVGIIILSGRGDSVDRVVGLEMGADDYITKPFEPRETLARIRSVMRRMRLAPSRSTGTPAVTYTFDGWVLDPSSHALFNPNGDPISLTGGEYRLLEALVTHANRVLSRDQLMEWTGTHDSPAFDRSIDTRIGRLRRKLQDHAKRPRYIKTVHNSGYLFAAKVTVG
jgi:two-component system OmpR family response regulator